MAFTPQAGGVLCGEWVNGLVSWTTAELVKDAATLENHQQHADSRPFQARHSSHSCMPITEVHEYACVCAKKEKRRVREGGAARPKGFFHKAHTRHTQQKIPTLKVNQCKERPCERIIGV